MNMRNQDTTEGDCPPTDCSAKLIVDHGMIRLKNGAPSGEYLRKWQTDKGYKNGTPVRVITQEHFQDLIARAQMAGIG